MGLQVLEPPLAPKAYGARGRVFVAGDQVMIAYELIGESGFWVKNVRFHGTSLWCSFHISPPSYGVYVTFRFFGVGSTKNAAVTSYLGGNLMVLV